MQAGKRRNPQDLRHRLKLPGTIVINCHMPILLLWNVACSHGRHMKTNVFLRNSTCANVCDSRGIGIDFRSVK